MKYLGLLSPGLQVFFFEKFVKPSSPSSYVRSLIRFEQMRKDSVSLKTINTLESFKSL